MSLEELGTYFTACLEEQLAEIQDPLAKDKRQQVNLHEEWDRFQDRSKARGYPKEG